MDDASFLTNQPVVIDNGSGVIKAGFAGEDQPKCFFPSYVGRPKHTRIMAGAVEGDTFVGPKAQELRGLLKVKYPLEHGVVTDWDDMERIWQYLYSEELKVLPEEHPVLLTEAPLNPRQNRTTMAQILFESFNVPALYTSIQAVLALYASGRTTGLVLDSGDGVTHSVPVYEGFALTSGIQRMDLAGRDVTEYLQLLMRKGGYRMETSAEKEIVRGVKEKMCFLSVEPRREEKEWVAAEKTARTAGGGGKQLGEEYRLPDGQSIRLGAERFRAPEILFDPSLLSLESPPLPTLLTNSLSLSDLDLRPTLSSNIILSGGTTLLRNFGDRLLNELKTRLPKDSKIKIYAPPERVWSTWIGGSILGSLSTWRRMWVSAEEYGEDPECIHRKWA
ncbi:actin-2 [Saitoella complicata NRRL Y-17804]|uniref:actin-2 n=1 Tax=Saitoella complicata (strain BCRC 22490 / CBS 7301 / JCM 7358 / NBRC 10748 / NRRL Y-17804) TaxID=698492 RepID=UPI00086734A9|nr:actin-2 [Saitoella complicata NRRL Y-17804]ODQ54918.1 actin-2 [Saitoella complicata NRRL Y-17804]